MGCRVSKIGNGAADIQHGENMGSGSFAQPSARNRPAVHAQLDAIPRQIAGRVGANNSAESATSERLPNQVEKFVGKIDLRATRSDHFSLMGGAPKEIERIKQIGQVSAAFEEKFSKVSKQPSNIYEHPGGIEQVEVGNVSLYLANDRAKNHSIVIFGHGMGEPGAVYKPAIFQSPAMRFARPNSRGDEAMRKDFNVGVISFKRNGTSPLIPTNSNLRDAVIDAVKSYKCYLDKQGEQFDAKKIVLMGKSRGTKAVLAAAPELRRQGIQISQVILEAPILNAAALKLERAREMFKNEPELYSIADKAIEEMKADFIENHMRLDRDYDIAASLDELSVQLKEDGGRVTFKVIKAELDATVGDIEGNRQIKKLFYTKGNVVARGTSSEDGSNMSWNVAKDGHCFNEDGTEKLLDGENGIFIEYHEIPGSELHGLNKIQLPLGNGEGKLTTGSR